MKYLFFISFFCSTLLVSGRDSSSFGSFYQQDKQTSQNKAPYGELFTENYQDNHLMSGGWDDDNPDGITMGENTGVAVMPIRDGIVYLIFVSILYCVIIRIRRKK